MKKNHQEDEIKLIFHFFEQNGILKVYIQRSTDKKQGSNIETKWQVPIGFNKTIQLKEKYM